MSLTKEEIIERALVKLEHISGNNFKGCRKTAGGIIAEALRDYDEISKEAIYLLKDCHTSIVRTDARLSVAARIEEFLDKL